MTFVKGDPITAVRDFYPESSDSYLRDLLIPAGTPGEITSVRSNITYSVKFDGYNYVRLVHQGEVTSADPATLAEYAAAEAAEKKRLEDLATPKEGDIMPDDPRLAWLWAKIEQDPQVIQYCDTYDVIVDKLGIPGRLRTFRATFHYEGLDLTAELKGHGVEEVEKAVAEKFAGATKITALSLRRR